MYTRVRCAQCPPTDNSRKTETEITTGLRAVPCDTATYCGRTHVQPTQHGNEARASDVVAPHPSSLTCVVACLWYRTLPKSRCLPYEGHYGARQHI